MSWLQNHIKSGNKNEMIYKYHEHINLPKK